MSLCCRQACVSPPPSALPVIRGVEGGRGASQKGTERLCHGMLLSVTFRLDGLEVGPMPGAASEHRGNPSRGSLESPRPSTHMRQVHRTGPRADSQRLYLQAQPEEEADRYKQTVEAGKAQRKPQLGITPQAPLMTGREISNRDRMRGRRTRLPPISRDLSFPTTSWFSSFRPIS